MTAPGRRGGGPTLSRRTLLAGGGAALAGGGALLWLADQEPPAAARPGVAARRAPDTLRARYETLRADLDQLWWDPRGGNTSDGMPAIRPTDGSGGPNTGRPNRNAGPPGLADARNGSFWQEAQYLRFLGNDRTLRNGGALDGDPLAAAATARVLAQRAFWRTIYTQDELSGAGAHDGTVNVSDDAAWKLQALKALHEASGDAQDLQALSGALTAICDTYRDTFTPAHQVAIGPLTVSRYGMLYARPEQDPNGQGRSTLYECGTLDASLYLYAQTRRPEFLLYPRTVYASFRERLQQPSGIFFLSLQLDPAGRHDSTPFLQPIEAYKATPRQDFDGSSILGTMGMAVVAAGLWRATGDAAYRQDVAHIAEGIAAQYFQNGCLICDRDPWTAGGNAYDFATRCLGMPGVDPDGRVATAIRRTGARILSTRVAVEPMPGLRGHGYSAEWSGNTDASVGESRTGGNDGVVTWAANAGRANNGRGGGLAAPDQIMTNSSSGAMVQAAVHLERAGLGTG